MAKVKVPEAPELLTTKYQTLRGVDYSVTPVEVSREHSPDMINMISDKGGNPVKRVGWRTIHNFDEWILDMHSSMDSMYIATNQNVYEYPSLKRVLNKDNPTRYIHNISLFSFDGMIGYLGRDADGYFYQIGKDLYDEPNYKIPTIIISRKPDGSSGTFHESINILTPYRTVTFLGDATSREYHIVPKKDEMADEYRYVKVTKVEIMNENGVFEETHRYTLPDTVSVEGYNKNGKLEKYDVHAPYITFTDPHAPVVTGQDNVSITYMAFDNTLVNTNFEKDESPTSKPKGIYNEHFVAICNKGIVKNYGYQNNDRLFILADDNRIYYSEVNNPCYIPDDNYIAISNISKVVGLHRYDKYLVVITKDNEDDSAMYFVQGVELQDGETSFALEATAITMGALNYGSFDTLIDEPLFLSSTGIYGISNHFATTRMAVRSRSMFIDKKLLKEENLENSVSVVWDKYYILAVNNHCYVLDGRQVSKDRKSNTDYSYEAYYWENVPAKVFGVYDNELYFGYEGKLCKFNTDVKNNTAYQDNGVLTDGKITGGVPIFARWSTPLDYEGNFNSFKTLNKKGNTVIMKPYNKTSVDVYFSVNGQEKEYYKNFRIDMQGFEYVDFSNFNFMNSDIARNIFLRKKIKKYKALQVILENEEPYEPFGIITLVKTYSIGNFAK